MADQRPVFGLFINFIHENDAAVFRHELRLFFPRIAGCEVNQFADHVIRAFADISGFGVIGRVNNQRRHFQQIAQDFGAIRFAAPGRSGNHRVFLAEPLDFGVFRVFAQIGNHGEMIACGDADSFFIFFLPNDVFIQMLLDFFGSEGFDGANRRFFGLAVGARAQHVRERLGKGFFGAILRGQIGFGGLFLRAVVAL